MSDIGETPREGVTPTTHEIEMLGVPVRLLSARVETRTNVMGARTMNMGVDDYGVTTEAVWTHVVPGACLKDHAIDADPQARYLMTHHLFQIFAYTNEPEPRLIAERIYDDPESYTYEKLAPADVVTPELARERLAPFLARATLD